jgi:hypothetical protein
MRLAVVSPWLQCPLLDKLTEEWSGMVEGMGSAIFSHGGITSSSQPKETPDNAWGFDGCFKFIKHQQPPMRTSLNQLLVEGVLVLES